MLDPKPRSLPGGPFLNSEQFQPMCEINRLYSYKTLLNQRRTLPSENALARLGIGLCPTAWYRT